MAVGGGFGVVGDHQHSLTQCSVGLAQHSEHDFGILGIEIAGGQDQLKGRIFRIGTMGAIGRPEVLATLAAVQYSLKVHGTVLKDDGLLAACEVLG